MQNPEQRRLSRIASAYNAKARKLGVSGFIYAVQLANKPPRCFYCGIDLPTGQGTFDHVIPFASGGMNTDENIVRCCLKCNRAKFTKTSSEHLIYSGLEQICPIDGVKFRPRFSSIKAGYGKFCSRRCAAKSRWAND